MSLDPSPEEMRRLAHLLADLLVDQVTGLPAQRVSAGRVDSARMRELVDEPLPRAGLGIERSIRRFLDEILPHATRVNHPRFFAYVPGPGSFAGALGEWIAATTNLFVGTWLGGASMVQLELLALDWTRQAVGLPAGFEGIVTSGGSMATLGALAAARARAGGPDTAAPGVVYTSDQAHYSAAKAARILAVPHVRVLATDADQRLPATTVREAIAADRRAGLTPWCVIATAGTTSTGAIDPLPALADLCADEGVWLHVDAAYGGAVALADECRPLLEGMERADSVGLDPHKWMYVPFECGCLLVRDVAALRAAFGADAAYLQDLPEGEVHFYERGPELSRGNRALKLWLTLRAIGIEALASAVREDLRLCRLARDLIAADPRFEIVTEPSLSVFTFAVRDGDATTRALLERLLADGFVMLSSSRIHDRDVLRFCVANHRTSEDDIRAACAHILQ
ncbi:MAG: pyridoxal-dependent decarboxylase [Planctomycetota bacterium]